VRVAYRLGDHGPQLEIAGEDDAESGALQEFTQAALTHGSQLQLERVDWDAENKSVTAIVVEAAPPPDTVGTLPAGYSVRGWSDRCTDPSGDRAVQWDYELEVRPHPATEPHGPVHGFVARARVTASAWDRDAEEWVRVDGPSTVYYGEHASLLAGVKAVKKAYDRARALREGP
jgi:hypothetical protein